MESGRVIKSDRKKGERVNKSKNDHKPSQIMFNIKICFAGNNFGNHFAASARVNGSD